MTDVMKKNENALWISVIILFCLSAHISSSYSSLAVYWVISIVFAGNARRIGSNRFLISTTIVRRNMYVIPLLLPLLTHSYEVVLKFRLWEVVFGIFIGVMFLLPKYKEWKLLLHPDFLLMTFQENRLGYVMDIYSVVAAAICEEMFFRNYILNLNNTNNIEINIFLSIFLFSLHHFGTKWSDKFSIYDFLIQIIFGAASVTLFIYFKSVVPSIVAHLTYNSIHVYKNFRYLTILSK